MSFTPLLSRPVVLVKRDRTSSDPYGEDVLVDGDRVDLLGVVHQRTTAETLTGQDTLGAGWIAMLDPDVVVDPDDVLEVDGVRFEIEGVPYRPWNYRLARPSHWELSLIESVG